MVAFLDKPAYLPPNSQSMQKPIEGLSAMALFTAKNRPAKVPLNKGGIVLRTALEFRKGLFLSVALTFKIAGGLTVSVGMWPKLG
jgi:hypothetical protein